MADSSTQLATGTATAITLAITTLTDLFTKTFIVSADNGGVATTINGKPLYKPNTTIAPSLTAGKAVTVWYNSTSDCFFIKASATGDALVGDVLAPRTFSNGDDTDLVGTIASKGSQTYTPSTSTQTITAGKYLSGNQTISGDSDLIASNILSGKSIFDVTGTLVKGKGYASGTAVNTSGVGNPFTVAGLSFRPSLVLVFNQTNYFIISDVAYPNYSTMVKGTVQNSATINGDGFTCSSGVSVPTNHTWEAYE